ncbi:hypothetical protein FsymDg_1747 [Candidatus Protofrankia datiscae]|uniref:Uncharacterized protein n=1 Tax=Candidatus Protofrankia datiscae TaxID=2716812 RepID=F8B3H0_9ACTN|nr:hypothetical protein FsymDg_1747 [Candidatus Protofrankia datiscae]
MSCQITRTREQVVATAATYVLVLMIVAGGAGLVSGLVGC